MNTALMEITRPEIQGGVQTMSSKEIAELTGKEHRNVKRDIATMLDLLGADMLSFEHIFKDSYGRTQTGFKLPKRETLVLVSGYSVPLRARIIDRWQELEAQTALAVQPVIDLENPASLRGLLLGYTEKVITLEAKVEEQKPKADFYDDYVDSAGRILFRALMKQLQCGQRELREFLMIKHMYHTGTAWLPRAEYVRRGYFEVKACTFSTGASGYRIWFTPKGVAKITAGFRKWQAANDAAQAARTPKQQLPDHVRAMH